MTSAGQGYDGAPWTTLVWGENYEMTWQFDYETQDEEIVLEWLMFEAPGTEKPVQPNETDMFIDYRGKGPERFIVAYSQNISAYTVGWYFQPSLSYFPNDHHNISSIQATGYALERNVFRLYHPKTFNPHNSTTWDLSEPFMVIRPWEENMIKKAASNQKKADRKQLAIGVGVGVGVAWFVAFSVAWYVSAWYQRKVLENKGFVLSPARLD
ncbi:hypothetical protein E8E12_008042 [Didymella heteroderae]|uniref:Uncharacterized protein n=1 Tax=Didymella heteroderae TaxID=1769908 RepID=A0A9P5C3M8_9PLEO|nr:hypothetical protein E8E12_008042 [Didymella heteroderae]